MTGKQANLKLRFGCKVRRYGWPPDAYIRSDAFCSYTSRSKTWKFEKLALYVHGPIKWVDENEAACGLLALGWEANDWEVLK